MTVDEFAKAEAHALSALMIAVRTNRPADEIARLRAMHKVAVATKKAAKATAVLEQAEIELRALFAAQYEEIP